MNEKNLTGEAVLKEALHQYSLTYCDEFPPCDEEIHLDEIYQRKMEKLIKRSKNPFRLYFNTAGRRAAGIAAAILVFFGCSMTVSAVRKTVVEFFTNAYEKLVEFFFDDESVANAPSTIETVYTLGYIPEGYELKEIERANVYVKYILSDDNGNEIVFSQNVLGGVITLDNEKSNYTIFYSSGVKIGYVEKFGVKAFEWNSSEYKFSLTVPSGFYLEECVILIESLVPIDSTELEVIE